MQEASLTDELLRIMDEIIIDGVTARSDIGICDNVFQIDGFALARAGIDLVFRNRHRGYLLMKYDPFAIPVTAMQRFTAYHLFYLLLS